MKKDQRQSKKLQLSRETLTHLAEESLSQAAGGATDISLCNICITTNPAK